MNQLTKKGGKVFVMAPERAGTMRKFVSLAEEYFSIGNIYSFKDISSPLICSSMPIHENTFVNG